MAYLRLAYGHDDDAAFERVINTPTRGIGNKTVEAIRLRARTDNTSLWRACEALLDESGLTRRALTAVQGFMALIDDCDEACQRAVTRSCSRVRT